MDKVYVYKCSSYNEESKKILLKLIDKFDCLKNIKENSKVVIKANLVSAMGPEKAATTHPFLLKVLTDFLLEKKCQVIIGDSPGGLYNKPYLSHIYNVTKMKETKAQLNDDFSIADGYFENAKVLKKFQYTKYLDNADLIINFCKLKSHGMMGMSCCVKNLFGTIPGTLKPEYHYRFSDPRDFANMLIDLNLFFKPSVNFVDAIVGMEGNGPTMGDPKNVGCILGSENPFALDFICSKIIGLDIKDVETINQSYKRLLFDPLKIDVNDDINKFVIKDFKVKKDLNSLLFFSNKKGLFSKTVSKISKRIFSNKPDLIKKKCIGCGKCANICPAKAIKILNKKAVIDRTKCIKCYCCQEFCPKGAMVVKNSFIAKIINRKK